MSCRNRGNTRTPECEAKFGWSQKLNSRGTFSERHSRSRRDCLEHQNEFRAACINFGGSHGHFWDGAGCSLEEEMFLSYDGDSHGSKTASDILNVQEPTPTALADLDVDLGMENWPS